MREVPPSEPRTPETGAGLRRKRPPTWGIALFLVLLAGLVVVNQLAATGGTPVQWIENDLSAALKQAAERKTRVFLYLYETGNKTQQRNEREVFSQRWAREPLKNVACCRLALDKGDLRRLEYGYGGTPLFLLLDETGRAIPGLRIEGAPDERQFFTYIGKPITDFVKRTH